MCLIENTWDHQRLRVCHVASATVTASLECAGMPTIPKMIASVEGYNMEIFMPCKAQAVLVP